MSFNVTWILHLHMPHMVHWIHRIHHISSSSYSPKFINVLQVFIHQNSSMFCRFLFTKFYQCCPSFYSPKFINVLQSIVPLYNRKLYIVSHVSNMFSIFLTLTIFNKQKVQLSSCSISVALILPPHTITTCNDAFLQSNKLHHLSLWITFLIKELGWIVQLTLITIESLSQWRSVSAAKCWRSDYIYVSWAV